MDQPGPQSIDTRPTGVGEQWRASPWTLKGFVAIEVAWWPLGAAVGTFDGSQLSRDTTGTTVGGFIFAALLSAVLIFFLLRGSRAAWIFALIWGLFGVLGSIGVVVREPRDDTIGGVIYLVFSLASLALLIHPLTRAWCKRKLKLAD